MHMCRGGRIALVRLPSSVHSIILIGFIRGLNLIPALCAALGSVCVCVYLCLMFTTHPISHRMFSMQQKWGDGLTLPYHCNKNFIPPCASAWCSTFLQSESRAPVNRQIQAFRGSSPMKHCSTRCNGTDLRQERSCMKLHCNIWPHLKTWYQLESYGCK